MYGDIVESMTTARGCDGKPKHPVLITVIP